MIGKGKEWQTHVGEYEILGKKVEQLKDFLSPPPRLLTHVDIGVIGLSYAAK